MKWRIKSYIVVFIITLILSLSNTTIIDIYAQHPYVGGYFSGDTITTSHVIMGTNFPIMFTNIIPENEWISLVLSVAGGNPSVSGYVYQSGLFVFRNGSVICVPQIWYGSTEKWYEYVNSGDYNYITWYLEIFGITDGVAEYAIYIYDTFSSYINNYPVVKIITAGIDTDDNVFIIGNQYKSSVKMKFLQFGVEASMQIGERDKWDIQNYEIGYFDLNTGQWTYLPGYSVQHDQSYITYIGNNFYGIGGINYNNVDKYISSDDSVRWRYTNTTINTDELLWKTSGIYTPYPFT